MLELLKFVACQLPRTLWHGRASKRPAVAGKILIKYGEEEGSEDNHRHYHHIEFLDDDDKIGDVIQAEQASAGVHTEEPYLASSWKMRRRLGDIQVRLK